MICTVGQALLNLYQNAGMGRDDAGSAVSMTLIFAAAHPAMAYLQTGPHSPTGLVLPRERRREVADLLVASRVPLVEDLALAGLAWAPGPPPLAALVPSHPTAVVGSLSKLLWGGLRLGFVRAGSPVKPNSTATNVVTA